MNWFVADQYCSNLNGSVHSMFENTWRSDVHSYNTLSKTFIHLKISRIKYIVPEHENIFIKIDEIFDEIKLVLNEEFGCACVILSSKYMNTDLVCKKFVDSAVLKVFLWKHISGTVVFAGRIRLDKTLLNSLVAEKIGKDSNVILFNHNSRLKQFFKKAFPNFKYKDYQFGYWCLGALYKARIMGNDPDIAYLDVQSRYGTSVNLSINDIELMRVEYGMTLPVIKRVEYNMLDTNNSFLVINAGTKRLDCFLSKLGRILIILEIDADKTYSVKYMQIPINDDFSIWADMIMAYSNDGYTETSNVVYYKFPTKIQTNDDSINATGIDLGTSRCCSAVNRREGIKTVALDNKGERQLPSFVAFDEKKEKCGRIVIHRYINHARSSVFDAKRIIGKRFDEIEKDENWPFGMETFKIVKPKRQRRSQWINGDDVLLKINVPNGTILKRPEDISAALLKHIKLKVEEFQGKRLSEAVITIPAAFSETQKRTTYNAAILAGWETIYLLPEPVAAAFAYFINRPIPKKSTLLLFDLGGGTLDVCIFKIKNKKLHIISRSGDPNIGGRDFDNLLIQHFTDILTNLYNCTITENKKYKLFFKCQIIKESLSEVPETYLDAEEIDFSIEGDTFITVTREEFEEMSLPLLQKIRQNINTALEKICLNPNKIDKVLQVGGGCRMPMIKKLLLDMFPNSEQCCDTNPDEVVAIGAAYCAYYINQEDKRNCSVM
uniref:Uncharacterized protein n=1 Tax=Panagrolaimus davidi TaxID=227884 RepID=A0A914QJ38_9BILA